LLFNSAWGLLGPIFAVFLVEKITFNAAKGAEVAGFAALIYWVFKSFLQIPIGAYLDKNHGEKDDFWFMAIGTLLCGLVPFGFIFATLPEHIYLLQIVYAVAMSMIIPSSYAIFTRHIDKGKEASEWSIDSTVLGFGVGITGALGGIIAGKFGFDVVFILTGLINLCSGFFLITIRHHMSSHNMEEFRFPPTKPVEEEKIEA
jgi:MFS family permease